MLAEISREALFIGNFANAQIENRTNAKRMRRGCIKVARAILIEAIKTSDEKIELRCLRKYLIRAAMDIRANDAVGSSYPIAMVFRARVGFRVKIKAIGREKFTNLD
jgi:hypothetical protein